MDDRTNQQERPSGMGPLQRRLLWSSAIGAALTILIGAVAVTTTLSIQRRVEQKATVYGPMVEASLKLDLGIEDSFASTLGWVTLGDPDFKAAHREAWRRLIDPAMTKLRELGPAVGRLAEIESLLLELKTIQWHIHDVAKTPGDNPARVLYDDWIEPSLASAGTAIDDLFDILLQTGSSESQTDHLLYKLRNALTRSAAHLDHFVRTGTALSRTFFERHGYAVRALSGELAALSLPDDSETRDLRAFLLQELNCYTTLGSRVAEVRSEQQSSIARNLLKTKADPIVRRLDILAESVAHGAINTMREHGADTRQTVVIALWALGILVFATSAAALLAAVVTGRRIVVPLRALVTGAERLARGDLSIDIPVLLDDEIGQLTQVFNLMSRELKTNLLLLNNQKSAMDEHAIVSMTDVRGNITYVNDKFCKLSGYSRDELIGRNHRMVKSDEHSPEFYRELWSTIARGEVWHGELKNRCKDGSHYWVDATIVPFKGADGRIEQYVSIRTDVTNVKEAEGEATRFSVQLEQTNLELEGQKEETEAMNAELTVLNASLEAARIGATLATKAKSDFLANMSHEIRTPMTAILGYSENLQDGGLSESETGDAIETIHKNGEYLLTIINDILDMSKIEAGKMEVENISCSPHTIIADVASLMKSRTDAKKIVFNTECAGPIPETIQSDPTRLKQILINIIGNAIKFTDEAGTVRLVTRFVDDADEPALQFDVIDTGRGMTEVQVDRLFQPFMQADTSTTRKFGGTGLGLTISKRFAELLGGNIAVAATEKGVGSTFRVTVTTGPLDGVKMLDGLTSATVVVSDFVAVTQAPRSDLQGCRILLAEDGPDNQRLIAFILKKAGSEVTVVENGKLAHHAALAARDHGNPFDVVLMDMQMPVMDGYQAAGQLRQEGYAGPIIALTAHAMASDRQKCIDAGCDDYATKPIDRKKLLETIEAHLHTATA